VIDTNIIREKILDLAMKGKLVDQDVRDGNAKLLLADIEREKSQLIKEKKIKTQKALPAINQDEIPYEIPENWTWVRLDDIATFHMGKTPSKSQSEYWESEDYPWVTIADMKQSKIIKDTNTYVSESAYKNVFKKNISRAGDLLMSFKLTIGRTSILGVDAFHNEAIVTISNYLESEIIKYYLMYTLPILSNYGQQVNAIKGKTLNKQLIRKILIPIPPLAEQERIVEKIEEIFKILDTIDASQKQITDLSHLLKEKVLDRALRGELVNQNTDDGLAINLLNDLDNKYSSVILDDNNYSFPHSIPSNWSWTHLRNLCTTIGGFAFKSKDLKGLEGVRIIRISDFNEYGIIKQPVVRTPFIEKYEKFEILENDILMAMTGGSVGKNTIVKSIDEPLYSNQRVATIRVFDEIYPLYVFYVIQSEYIKNIINFSKNSFNDNISMKTIKNFPIPLPPLEEQKRIVEAIEDIFASINQLTD